VLNLVAVAAILGVVLWPGVIFARLMLRDLPPEAWRITTGRRSHRWLARTAAIVMAVAMLVGARAIVQPLHQRDLIAMRDSFPHVVLRTRVLKEETMADVFQLTVLATNDSQGLLVLASDRVVRYDDGTVGRIVDWNGPKLLQKGEQTTLTMTFPVMHLPDYVIPLKFSASYLDTSTTGIEAERDRIVTDDLVTFAGRNPP
jgi:hypothetical protein